MEQNKLVYYNKCMDDLNIIEYIYTLHTVKLNSGEENSYEIYDFECRDGYRSNVHIYHRDFTKNLEFLGRYN